MNEDLIEQVARAIIGPHNQVPATAKYTLEELREIRWEQAGTTGQAVALRDAKAAIAAMQPPIAAEREDAARRALEAAADILCGLVAKHAKDALVAESADRLGLVIRAIDPAQFREAGNGG